MIQSHNAALKAKGLVAQCRKTLRQRPELHQDATHSLSLTSFTLSLYTVPCSYLAVWVLQGTGGRHLATFVVYNIEVHDSCTEENQHSWGVPQPSCEPECLYRKVLQSTGELTQECTDRWGQGQASLKQAMETESRTCL